MIDSPAEEPAVPEPLVRVSGLSKHYRVPARRLFGAPTITRALDGVDLSIARGESVAVVGESGSGKTTLLRLVLGLSHPTAGTVEFDGRPVDASERMLWLRRRTGMVFQDPYSSFNPRRTVGQSVAEPLIAADQRAAGERHEPHEDRRSRVREILDRLGLPENAIDRYPHEFSGGQRQRLAVARALVHGPELLLADEPVSALDVLVRARLLELLAELRDELGLTVVTVTHDLGIVPTIAERVVVMRAGRIVEAGPTERIFSAPREAYTRELIAALPRLGG